MAKKSELAQQKHKFRQTNEWKNYRAQLIENQKIDPITLSKLNKGAECHHLLLCDNIEDYMIMDSDHQIMLNSKTHNMIHFLYGYYQKDKDILIRLKDILELMYRINSGN